MIKTLRVILGSLCFVLASYAAPITFNATITDATGTFASLVTVGTTITGVVDITSASSDANINPRVGEYSLAIGSIQLSLNGVPFVLLQSGPFTPVSVLVEDSLESGPDVVTYTSSSMLVATNEEMVQAAANTFNVAGFFRLTGMENFLVNGDSLPTGPSGFNWNQFVDGYGEFGDAVQAVFEGSVPTNGFTFVVDTAVPEPGTLFGVAAGGLVLFLKRRQSR